MFSKKSKGGVIATLITPYMLIATVLGIIIILLIVVVSTFWVVYNDAAANTATLLPAMLNSRACTPNTQMPFKDVIATGISIGKTGLWDIRTIEYANAIDGSFTAGACLDKISKEIGLSSDVKYNFYVKYRDCSQVKCVVKTAYDYERRSGKGAVVETEIIAMPDGRVSTIFLER